jgi:hypothetical protein
MSIFVNFLLIIEISVDQRDRISFVQATKMLPNRPIFRVLLKDIFVPRLIDLSTFFNLKSHNLVDFWTSLGNFSKWRNFRQIWSHCDGQKKQVTMAEVSKR